MSSHNKTTDMNPQGNDKTRSVSDPLLLLPRTHRILLMIDGYSLLVRSSEVLNKPSAIQKTAERPRIVPAAKTRSQIKVVLLMLLLRFGISEFSICAAYSRNPLADCLLRFTKGT